MKLIVKLPRGKPPFIGVLLADSDNRAYPERLNEDLINEHKYAGYRLVLNFSSGYLNLSLVSDEGHLARHYNDLEFESARLVTWIYNTRQVQQLNFGHVRLERGREAIVKTWGRKINFVLPLQGYEVNGNLE